MPCNLKNREATQFKSGSQAVEAGRKGGIASGESKKKKKTMAELAKMIAEHEVNNPKDKKKLAEMGILGPDATNDALAVSAMWRASCKGDVKAFEKWQELTSEHVDEELEKLDSVLDQIGGVI